MRLTADERPIEAMAEDTVIRFFENEAVAWGPGQPWPLYLDPVASLVVQMLDGEATVAELAEDVHEIVGVPNETAVDQIRRSVSLLRDGGVLEGAVEAADEPPDDDGVFRNPPSP